MEQLRGGVAWKTGIDLGATGFWAESIDRTKREAILRLSCEVSHDSNLCLDFKAAFRMLES
jgi:hypothetical protein